MSLDYILLGLLREPASGYDVKREFDGGARHFWHAELSQIYPTLKRLEGRGLLESRVEPSDRGPDRRVYRTTDAGRRALTEWLAEGPAFGRLRLEYVAQVFFLGELRDAAAGESFLRQLRASLAAYSAALEEAQQLFLAEQPEPLQTDDETFYQYATLQLGRRVARARLDWCDEILEMVRSRSGGAGRDDGAAAPDDSPAADRREA